MVSAHCEPVEYYLLGNVGPKPGEMDVYETGSLYFSKANHLLSNRLGQVLNEGANTWVQNPLSIAFPSMLGVHFVNVNERFRQALSS